LTGRGPFESRYLAVFDFGGTVSVVVVDVTSAGEDVEVGSLVVVSVVDNDATVERVAEEDVKIADSVEKSGVTVEVVVFDVPKLEEDVVVEDEVAVVDSPASVGSGVVPSSVNESMLSLGSILLMLMRKSLLFTIPSLSAALLLTVASWLFLGRSTPNDTDKAIAATRIVAYISVFHFLPDAVGVGKCSTGGVGLSRSMSGPVLWPSSLIVIMFCGVRKLYY
jgi:hypothetical protein